MLFGQEHVDRYRATDGAEGYEWRKGSEILLLTTKGRTSGEPRTAPLIFGREGDSYLIVASKGGAPTSPDWYFNLKANPNITVEFGVETFEATVTELPEDVGQAKLRAQAELMPQFGDYITSAAPRVIPAFHIARNA